MHVTRLLLTDFRSYAELDLTLAPGVTCFVGANGQGKTNIVEAVDYLSRLASHRVSSDVPLVRAGQERAVVQAAVVKDERTAVLDVEIQPGRANRARINRQPVPRTRDLIGLVRTVVFSPEDLAIVKGDPAERRRFLDDLMVLRSPHLAGVKADYERVLRQRNSLLKSSRHHRGSLGDTLEVWDEQLVQYGAELIAARRDLVSELAPHLAAAYHLIAQAADRDVARAAYEPNVVTAPDQSIADAFVEALATRHRDERDRGLTLVGPHRDELGLTVSNAALELPVRGYASHGESWSFALALKLASYELLRADGDDPILILDDVFAELDTTRRAHLAEIAGTAEQVLITAAVLADVPEQLTARTIMVAGGTTSEGG